MQKTVRRDWRRARRHAMQSPMKPTRKFRQQSFVSQVAGGMRGGALTQLAGPSRE